MDHPLADRAAAPGPRPSRSTRDPAPPAPYGALLEAEQAEIWEATRGDLDLEGEIRFMRAVLASLGLDKPREASVVVGALRGLVETQMKIDGSGGEIERALTDAAQGVLAHLAGEEDGDV